jgi:asparagine synthetase B (glutamine-hydrolysing)
MWIKIKLADFSITQEGFVANTGGPKSLFVSPGLESLRAVEDLKDAEYGVAVEIDVAQRRVAFGRDYLGHYPLLYTLTADSLFISDEFYEVRAHVLASGGQLTVSEEVLALYFTMGYVPHGATLLEQIVACENTSIYRYESGRVRQDRIFTPIDEDAAFPLEALGQAIEADIANIASGWDSVDVWCSGGLDSSSVAQCFNSDGRRARLMTIEYEPEIRAQYGEGELSYAQAVAKHCGVDLTCVSMTRQGYVAAHRQLTERHISPVFDVAIIPKYLLAGATRTVAATGEGGDPLFAGVKNTPFLFLRQNDSKQSLGSHYAMVHNRFFDQLETLFVRGRDLKAYVIEYFDRMFDSFPGSVLRKLLYINTLVKQGGLIFPENYYAAKRADVQVRHPLTGLNVYRAAFQLADERKYRYPTGKLALIDLFGARIPEQVVTRKKSGTRVPLELYLASVVGGQHLDLSELKRLAPLQSNAIAGLEQQSFAQLSALEVNAFVTLNNWLNQQGDNNDVSDIPHSSRHHH